MDGIRNFKLQYASISKRLSNKIHENLCKIANDNKKRFKLRSKERKETINIKYIRLR